MKQFRICIIDDSDTDQKLLLTLARSAFSSCSEFPGSGNYYLLVLLDIHLAEEEGIRCSRDISMHASFIACFSSCNERIMDSFAPETAGFLLKTTTDEELPEALKKIRDRYSVPSIQRKKRWNDLVSSFHGAVHFQKGKNHFLSFSGWTTECGFPAFRSLPGFPVLPEFS